jgi:hypothetical protein
MGTDNFFVDFGPEGFEALSVQVDAGGEIALFRAVDDDAGVDELLALNSRDHANDGVIK